MLDGIMALWFGLTAVSTVFVAVDIRHTPEATVMKWGFVLLTAYTGPIGAFLYVLGCREPLPGLHERYAAVRWRQVLGSTMHCVAGDGVGILAGAVVASLVHMPALLEVVSEYVLGFGFGWLIFQALFVRSEMGGSYGVALRKTFIPELLSMNLLMAGMVPVMRLGRKAVSGSLEPTDPVFWFVMSMALLVGFVVAYPMNWWLVSNHLKHGMMTVRPDSDEPAGHGGGRGSDEEAHHAHAAPVPPSDRAVARMTVLSFLAFGLSMAVSFLVI